MVGNTIQHFTTQQGLGNNVVHSILRDRSGVLWIGTEGGGLNSYVKGHFSKYGKEQGLSAASVFSIYEDKDGMLWLGTTEGLVLFTSRKFVVCGIEDGLFDYPVWSILEDNLETSG